MGDAGSRAQPDPATHTFVCGKCRVRIFVYNHELINFKRYQENVEQEEEFTLSVKLFQITDVNQGKKPPSHVDINSNSLSWSLKD